MVEINTGRLLTIIFFKMSKLSFTKKNLNTLKYKEFIIIKTINASKLNAYKI